MGWVKTVPTASIFLISLLCAAGILMAGVFLLTILVTNNSLQETHVDYGITLIMILSSATGSALFMRGQKSIAAALLFAGTFWALLLAITALFFDGMYHGITVTLLLILGGGLLPLFTGKRTKSRPYSKRSFIRHG